MTKHEHPETFGQSKRTGTEETQSWREGTPIELVAGRHPVVGALKDLILIDESIDLTEPAQPDWAEVADSKTI